MSVRPAVNYAATRAEQARLPWAYVGLVILPVAAFFAFEVLLAWLSQVPVQDSSKLSCADPQPALDPVTRWPEAAARWPEGAARMQLLATSSLYFLFGAVIVFKFGWDLFRLFRNSARLRLMVAYGLCVAVGAIGVWLAHEAGALRRATDLLGTSLFVDALNKAASYGPIAWGECAFKRQLDFATGITLLSVPAFIAGGISCLARFSRIPEKENWIFQVERLKSYVYMSAGLLVLGVLYVRAWAGYPSFMLETDQMKAAFSAVANSATMFIGIEFSIILAAYSLPVAWILSRRADKIAARIAHEEGEPKMVTSRFKIQEVRIRENLIFSHADSLRVIVALLAPLVTGALPTLSSILR